MNTKIITNYFFGGNKVKKLLLIDGNSLMFRAYYSTSLTGKLMQTKSGFVTNALHGFISMMNKVQKDFSYTHILVAFDTAKPTFRHQKLDSYKDGRKAMPEEFRPQIPLIKDYLDYVGITRYETEGFEADDIIGSFAKKGCSLLFDTIEIITGDKDMLQLVNECVSVYITRKGVTELEKFTPLEVMQKYEITPDKMTDLKGMMGDASDNLPGIPGVGEKTAIKLLKQFGSLENLLSSTDQLKGKQKENVETFKEQAVLCKEMATIDTEMTNIPEIEDLVQKDQQPEKIRKLFTEMEFNALLRTLSSPTIQTQPQINEEQIVTDANILDAKTYLDSYVEVEVFEPNYHQSTIIGFGIKNEIEHYFVPFSVAISSKKFIEFLTSDEYNKILFDAKRAIVALKWHGLNLGGVEGDLLLKAYVLNPTTTDTEFAKVALHYDIDGIYYDEQVYGKGAKRAIPEINLVAQFVLAKVTVYSNLDIFMTGELKKLDQWLLYQEIELPLMFILAQMEFDGIKIDNEFLKEMSISIKQRIIGLEEEIFEITGESFNVSSPKQLGTILFEKMGLPGKKSKTGSYSTSADILERLKNDYPVVEKVLEYRMLAKLYSNYIEGLQKACYDDNLVHTIFNQASTTTGRLSSTEPNVQNIPIRLEEGRLIRKAFVPSQENHVIVTADYSQIELRVLAHISQTEGLIEAFNNDEDVHKKTASEVFGVEIEDVTDAQRRGAKAINFGIVYGQSAFGLSEALNISMAKAKMYIEEYLETYNGIQKYMDDTIESAKENGYVQTLFLRRRYMPEINSRNFMVKSAAERTAINAPIQGSAADIIKLAMIEVDKLMKSNNLKSKMLLQVHDELVFDVLCEELEQMKSVIKKAMEEVTKLSVALKIEMNHGSNWYETK